MSVCLPSLGDYTGFGGVTVDLVHGSKSTAHRKLKARLSSNRIDANPFDTAATESHRDSLMILFFPAAHTTPCQPSGANDRS